MKFTGKRNNVLQEAARIRAAQIKQNIENRFERKLRLILQNQVIRARIRPKRTRNTLKSTKIWRTNKRDCERDNRARNQELSSKFLESKKCFGVRIERKALRSGNVQRKYRLDPRGLQWAF